MLTIGRLGALAEIEPKTLRYYDRVGLVRPTTRTPAGYRVYGEEAVQRLRFIRRAKALAMSLADIRRILAVRDEGLAPCQHVLALVGQNLAKVEGQIAQLERLRTDLRGLQRLLRDTVPSGAQSADDCPCIALIQDFHKLPRPRSRRDRRRGRHA
jgi:DNA-binding transcriptional MerR regulator